MHEAQSFMKLITWMYRDTWIKMYVYSILLMMLNITISILIILVEANVTSIYCSSSRVKQVVD
jgi:hypothetical protein